MGTHLLVVQMYQDATVLVTAAITILVTAVTSQARGMWIKGIAQTVGSLDTTIWIAPAINKTELKAELVTHPCLLLQVAFLLETWIIQIHATISFPSQELSSDYVCFNLAATGTVRCECDKPCKLLTANTEANRGRRFHRCPTGECEFFQ